MADVFISYVNTEREKARTLADALTAAGFSVWWDHNLIGGQAYGEVIEREIAAAKVVMPIWSKASIKSRWVLGEANRGGDKLFPVRIENVEPPLPYNQLQTLDLTGWNGNASDPHWMRLAEDLRAVISGAPNHRSRTLRTPPKSRMGAIAGGVTAGVVMLAAVGFFALKALPLQGGAPAAAAESTVSTTPTTPVAPEVASTATTTERVLTPAPQTTRGIRSYSDATQAIRAAGGQVSLTICAEQCGVTSVHVGQVIKVRVNAPVSGRLILVDTDSDGQMVQIFPNGLSSSGQDLHVNAGQAIDLPLPDQGFVFGVSPPAGASRLAAFILPDTTALPTIVASNIRTRGIQPIPQSRRDDFAVTVASALNTGAQQTAIGELNYTVVP